MTEENLSDQLIESVLTALEHTFEKSGGMYLDRGTSLFETLATVTAEQASRPASANCASIAAHMAHLCLSIDVVMQYINGEQPQEDWTEIWRTVCEVTPEEWAASQKQLRETYSQLRALVTGITAWAGKINLILAVLMHNAYHLGEIRHTLCAISDAH